MDADKKLKRYATTMQEEGEEEEDESNSDFFVEDHSRALSTSDIHDKMEEDEVEEVPLFRKFFKTPPPPPSPTPPLTPPQQQQYPNESGAATTTGEEATGRAFGLRGKSMRSMLSGSGIIKSSSETNLNEMRLAAESMDSDGAAQKPRFARRTMFNVEGEANWADSAPVSSISSSSSFVSGKQQQQQQQQRRQQRRPVSASFDLPAADPVAKSAKNQALQEIKAKRAGLAAGAAHSATFSKSSALREKILKQANAENQGLNPVNKLYKPIFRKDFLIKHVNRLETSIKVFTTMNGGDLFGGMKQTCEAVALDLDLLGFGGRKWGGGNGAVGEGIARLDFVELEALKTPPELAKASPYRAVKTEKLFWEKNLSFRNRCKQFILVKGRKSLSFWVIYCFFVLAALTAVLATRFIPDPYIVDDELDWDGMSAWQYFVFVLLFLVIPLLSFFLTALLARLVRLWLDAAKRTNAPSGLHEYLHFAFILENLNWEITWLFTFVFYTISFLAVFSIYPKNNQAWVDAYKYTTATFGSLAIFFLGRVITHYATHSITRNVDVQQLGDRVRKVLRREQALWEILQVTPNEAEESMFSQMEDPFLLFDPRMADHLAKGLIRTQFSGKYTQIKGGTVGICIESKLAGLLGGWVYQTLMKRSTTSTRGLPNLKRYDSSNRRRGGSGDSARGGGAFPAIPSAGTMTGKFEDDSSFHSSPKLRTSFMTMLSEAKARHGGQTAHAATVFPELDLSMPFNHHMMNLFGEAMYSPARQIGTVRGCPKRYVTISDVALCLERPEETLDHVWNDFLDCERQGKVDLRRVRAATIQLVNDRVNLKATLESNAKVKARLASVIAVMVNFCVLLIVLAIFGLNVLELWLSMSSIVLAFSFIFGGTLKNIFDSVVFLFGVHPYDIGDKIKLGPEEIPYWIDEIALMSTRMLRWDGSSVEFLNSYLYTTVNLVNVNRSGNHSITLHLRMDAASVPKKREMDRIRTELEEFLSRSSAFTGQCSVTCREFIFPLLVRVTVWFEFAYNDIDAGRTYSDTSKVIQFLILAFKKRRVKVSGVNSGAVDMQVGSIRLANMASSPGPNSAGGAGRLYL